jgi:hypothetical protein
VLVTATATRAGSSDAGNSKSVRGVYENVMRRSFMLGGLAGLLVVVAVAVWWHSDGTSSRRAGASGPTAGIIRGTLLAVGGPSSSPRPFSMESFEVVSRSGVVAARGRTTTLGRFEARVPPGRYVLSMPGIVIQTRTGRARLASDVLTVGAGQTIRPRLVVTNPHWA